MHKHGLVSVQHVQAYTIIIIIFFRKSSSSQYKIHGILDKVQLYVHFINEALEVIIFIFFWFYGLFFAKGKQLHLEQLVRTLIQFKLE